MIAEATGALELFYSYAHKDEKLRNELNKHLYNLKRQGLIVEWYDRDISAGTDWEQAIDTHLNTATVILLLISPDFMASDYCYSIEMKRALERHESGEARVIPILLKPVDWTGAPFSKLQMLPRNRRAVTLWKDRNAAFLEIANDVRETLKDLRKSSSINRLSSSVPTQFTLASSSDSIPLASFLEDVQAQQVELTPVWSVPFPQNLRFTGREEILQQLHESFTRTTANSFKQPLALSGLGGMGKTQIALEYAYRYREEYQVVLWAKADSQEVLTTELVSFATLLKVPGQQAQDQLYALAAVKHWLEVHSNWLLILDNIEDLTFVHDYLPTASRGHFLLTTNSQVMHGIARRLDIDKMESEEGVLLLLRRVGLLDADAPLDRASTQERIQATEICMTLGGHPLAIDQAGAYIEKNGANLHRYLELYAKRRAHLLETRGSILADHPESVTTTLSLSFEKVEQTSQAAFELLSCLTFLHPDAIPDTLLEQGASQLGTELQAVVSNALEFERAIGELRKYSLVRRNPDGATLTVHRLVQDVLKDSMDEARQRQWAEWVVRAANQAFPTEEFANWETAQQYLSQAQHCSVLIETWHFAYPEAARLLYKVGRYLDERGQYPEATAQIRQSLTIREQAVETQQHEVAESLNALAELYYKQGMYREAEPPLKRALAIREQVLGPNHPDTSRSLNNLALLYQEQKHFSEAEPLFKRALAIREQVLGPNHPDTATSLNNLALLYKEQGHFSEAEPPLKRALAIQEQVLGPNHPDTSRSLNNLAMLYKEQGHFSEAKPLFKRALAIYEQVLGPNHPYTATSLNNLAMLYKEQGHSTEAEPLLKRALAIYEQVLGPNHPDTAMGLGNLAALYREQGHFSETEPLLKRALAIYEQTFGSEHPSVVKIMGNYVQLFRATNRKGRAAEMEARLNILRRKISQRRRKFIS